MNALAHRVIDEHGEDASEEARGAKRDYRILPEESLEESSPGRYPTLQVSDKKVTRTKQDAASSKRDAVLQKLRRRSTPLKIDNDKILAFNRPQL